MDQRVPIHQVFGQDVAPEPMQIDAPFGNIVNEDPYIVECSYLVRNLLLIFF